ncbi:hypothetical protein EGH21_12690 [Halomicroarcula sp. F13]|uniref:RanBP2-type domain-containing protein n=1 Tax=Haloarcula rubra TaxID=2487747 RepID=A0AAW4PQL7_9EURY|nr:hypothetical protein [Halomicroarcula rubra]MBX0323888.1 hypothetical protein [Halomicroarcula rubra]
MRTTQSTSESEHQEEVWYCKKCKQKHTEEREQCKVCGTEEFKKVAPEPSEDSDNQYTHPDDDVETISNVREATSSPAQPGSGDSNLGFYLTILLLVILAGLAIYIL